MIFLNKNFIKSIAAIVLITIISVYAEPVPVDICIHKLNKAGFTSSNNALENYANTGFKKIMDDQSSISKSDLSAKAESACEDRHWHATKTHLDALEEYYNCHLFTYIHTFNDYWEEPKDFCLRHFPYTPFCSRAEFEPYHKCTEDIKSDKFDFYSNIDYYAYSYWIKKNTDMFNALKPNTQNYANSLTPKDIKEVDNTTNWCKFFACEVVLFEAGFKDRMYGFINFKDTVLLENQKSCAKYNGLAKTYCDDLLLTYGPTNLTPRYDDLFYEKGTYIWCKNNKN